MKTNNPTHPGFVIAGTHSSVGKTSITLGFLRAIKRRQIALNPFKAGPDYIDPAHHSLAAGVPSYNLDSWMCSRNYLAKLFQDVMQGKSLAVVEGVMGLFDGAHATRETGTTAEVARLLDLPVLLVIDGSQMARSAAALVKGFAEFDPRLRFLGVIANRVGSPGHARLIEQALKHHTGIPLLGHLPVNASLNIPERHLGLHQSVEQSDRLYEGWADHIEQHVNLDRILRQAGWRKKEIVSPGTPPPPSRWPRFKSAGFQVGIARDPAFQFCYQDTLDLIRHLGGNVHFFSPVNDPKLPPQLDWVYFPGGYPELYAEELSQNKSMLRSIKRFARTGGVLAECGGLMYAGKSIQTSAGKSLPMTGLFDFSTSIKKPGLTLGYRKLAAASQSRINPKRYFTGHEFHYSKFEHNNETPRFKMSVQGRTIADGFIRDRCLAFYSHIYWGASCRGFQEILHTLLLK